jgi:ribonuclease E
VASDIALYALNQKRRELARIEAEYGMEISFEPKEGLLAGTFELERTRVRDPGERPRSSAVGIEAGFVPSEEPEDDIPPEEDEEESEEDFAAPAESEDESEPRPREEHREDHQGEQQDGGGRKRRRRGGRGRGRERGPRPEGADTGHAPVEISAGGETQALANGGPAEIGQPQAEAPQERQAHGGPNPAGPNHETGEGEHRRKRRRRRGRRGGRDRHQGPEDQPAGIPNEAQRFGNVPDEIDTTPRAGGYGAPGAPSAPVWSLKDDMPDTTPKEEPAKTVKKGWWQRTFSGE